MMKSRMWATAVAAAAMLALATVANAGEPEKDGLVYHDATEFLIG